MAVADMTESIRSPRILGMETHLTDLQAPTAPPAWFRVAAILSVLWEALGCFMYVSQVSVDPATLPLDQRALWEATPAWSIGAYAVGVWVGLAGSILLLNRRKVAVPALLVSLVAVAIQFSALILVPDLSGNVSSDVLLLPVVILIVCYGVFQLSLLAKKNGWLR